MYIYIYIYTQKLLLYIHLHIGNYTYIYVYIYIYIYKRIYSLIYIDNLCNFRWFPKKGDLGLAKNYRGMTLTSTAAKIYNALLRNCIVPKIHNILRKTKMASEEIDPRPHKYWPSLESLKAYGQKTYRRHYYLSTSIPFTEERWNKSY